MQTTLYTHLFAPPELRKVADSDLSIGTVTGYAALYDDPIDMLGMWRERIMSGAFSRALDGGQERDVVGLWNHDMNFPLGRQGSTLRLASDDKGLRYTVQLPPSPAGEIVRTAIERGDVTGSSIGFIVRADDVTERDEPMPLRTITDVTLIDVSPVTMPANDRTTAELRSMQARIAQVRDRWRWQRLREHEAA